MLWNQLKASHTKTPSKVAVPTFKLINKIKFNYSYNRIITTVVGVASSSLQSSTFTIPIQIINSTVCHHISINEVLGCRWCWCGECKWMLWKTHDTMLPCSCSCIHIRVIWDMQCSSKRAGYTRFGNERNQGKGMGLILSEAVGNGDNILINMFYRIHLVKSAFRKTGYIIRWKNAKTTD